MADCDGSENGNQNNFIPKSTDESTTKNKDDMPEYKTASEYCNAVNKWLWQCYYAQSFAASLPYVLSAACQQQGTIITDLNRNIAPNNSFYNQPVNNLNNVVQQVQTPQRVTQQIGNREYILPPLWKRFLAEVIDFFILLIIKLMVTYIAVDFFEVIDLEKYDLDILRDEKMDYKAALEMTSDIVFLEIIHRFVVCIFEAVCLQRGALGPGGATPGKSFVNLRVVKCLAIENLPNNRIRVYPAEDIGFGCSLLRAFIKNFSMAFLQPACLTIFVFQHHRAAYDMICKSIVVEDLPRVPVRIAQ